MKIIIQKLKNSSVKMRIAAAFALFAALFGIRAYVYAHSVAQIQTTKYFSPETVQMLIDRANEGTPGLFVGDTISYIIQFSPVENGAVEGVNGYVTDYIPPGAEVIGAWIVDKDGSGNYYPVSPGLPGGIDYGYGNRGLNTYTGPFADGFYDTTGRCNPTTNVVDTYNSSTTWTAPSDVTSVTVEAWGGGGGGGGTSGTSGGSGGGG
ncbi:MAG: hypothetical protein HY809_05390, partial [Nitrospirae bacterium]|nr:hypothetical protein [Nitrospirota bacterium]